MPWKAECLETVSLQPYWVLEYLKRQLMAKQRCHTLGRGEKHFPEMQYKNHLAGQKTTLGYLNSCVLLMVTM